MTRAQIVFRPASTWVSSGMAIASTNPATGQQIQAFDALTAEQIARLDAASAVTPIYPYWHQRGFPERNPPPV